MKAITLHQPWASLVVIGAKRFETRSWAAEYQGPLAIHAGKNTDSLSLFWTEPFKSALEAAGYENPEDLPLGAIVGVVDLGECVETSSLGDVAEPESSFGNFEPGRYAWSLSNPRRCDPIEQRGYQKLWDWEEPFNFMAIAEGLDYKRPNRPFWVTHPSSSGGTCVFGTDVADVRSRCTAAGLVVASIGSLPYPASPQLNPDDNTSGCPPFCYTPRECVGNSCCRKSYACSE